MQLIDISLPLDKDLPGFPGDPPYNIYRTATHENDGFVLSDLKMGTHTGTHMDFPLHFIEEAKTVDRYPISKFSGKALVLDFSNIPLGQGISREDLVEKDHHDYPSADFILFKTINSTIYTHEFNPKFIYLKPDAAEYIANFDLKGVGIDYLSIEQYEFDSPKTHKTLLNKDILIIEGLILQNVDEGIYELYAFPINIKNAEGSPIRAVLRVV